MYCGKCGSPIPDGDSFCFKCGAPVSQKTEQINYVIVSQPVPTTTQTNKPRTSAWRVIGRVILVIVLIAIILEVLRACTLGMYQQGMLG